MTVSFVLAGLFVLLGAAIVLRPQLGYRYAIAVGRLDPARYPFSGRRVVWYRRASVAPFAIGALLLGNAISRL